MRCGTQSPLRREVGGVDPEIALEYFRQLDTTPCDSTAPGVQRFEDGLALKPKK
jgi:hypothetical protein